MGRVGARVWWRDYMNPVIVIIYDNESSWYETRNIDHLPEKLKQSLEYFCAQSKKKQRHELSDLAIGLFNSYF